ncbi:slc44a2 [Symbiodinium natans]|uniref:Slc44a2 protein n=1 Tax=Symbiodinium natans TaxID=878477 RepID=A0A812IES0_9DINO|nr:slc44a2 [Symbiodinium natans]
MRVMARSARSAGRVRQQIGSRQLLGALLAQSAWTWLAPPAPVANTAPVFRRSWLFGLAASAATMPLQAEAQVNAGLRNLVRRSRPRPETGVRMSTLGVMEGEAEGDGERLVAAEVLSSSETRVTVSFRTPWPVTSDRTSSSKGLEVRGKSAYAFLQVIPGVSGTATTDQILDAVLNSRGKFGAYGEPGDVRILEDKELASGQRQVLISFTSYSPQSAEFQNRAIVKSTTVDGDAFVLVGTAFDERWQKEPQVESSLRSVVGSFRVDPSKATER